MRNYVVFTKRICLGISFCIILAAALIGLSLKEIRTSFFAWFSFFILFSLIAGYVVAWIINIIFVRKLKDHFPEWKKEITQFCFGRFRVFRNPIISGGDLPSYIQKDPDIEIIKAERDTVRKISICWIYIPTTMLIILILLFVFLN